MCLHAHCSLHYRANLASMQQPIRGKLACGCRYYNKKVYIGRDCRNRLIYKRIMTVSHTCNKKPKYKYTKPSNSNKKIKK